MKPLTARQHEILVFVRDYIAAHSYPPTTREISARFGFRTAMRGAMDHLRALERKGVIELAYPRSRGIRITPLGFARLGAPAAVPLPSRIEVPVLQDAALAAAFGWRAVAGASMPAPFVAERVCVDRSTLVSDEVTARGFFGIRVVGDAMRDQGIHDGDLVVCAWDLPPTHGKVALVRLDGYRPMLRRYFVERDRIVLRAAHVSIPPVFVPRAHLRPDMILGTACAVLRTTVLPTLSPLQAQTQGARPRAAVGAR